MNLPADKENNLCWCLVLRRKPEQLASFVFPILSIFWPHNFLHLSLWHFGRSATTFFTLVWHFTKPDDGNLPLSVRALGCNSLPSPPLLHQSLLLLYKFFIFHFYQTLLKLLMSFNRVLFRCVIVSVRPDDFVVVSLFCRIPPLVLFVLI